MTLQQLKYAVAVAETGTFSEAAKLLFLSQPSLTKSIKELEKEMKIIRFMKNWTLPIAMLMGIVLYFVYVNIPFLESTKPYVEHAVAIVQPILIFLMLFLTFCKVNVSELRPCRWHLWLLLIQGGAFLLLALLIWLFPEARYGMPMIKTVISVL